MGDTQVRGGNTVLSFIKNNVGFLNRNQPPKEQPRRIDAQAAAVADRPPLLERRSNVPMETDGAQDSNGSPFARDSPVPQPDSPTTFGYDRTFHKRFKIVKELASGGNGVVSLAHDLETGQEWAVKSIPKVLTDTSLSDL